MQKIQVTVSLSFFQMILFIGPRYFLKCCHWIAGKDSGQRVMHTLPYLIKLVRGFFIHYHKTDVLVSLFKYLTGKVPHSDGKLVFASVLQRAQYNH